MNETERRSGDYQRAMDESVKLLHKIVQQRVAERIKKAKEGSFVRVPRKAEK